MVSRKILITTNLIALLIAGCSAKYQCEATKTGVCAGVEDIYNAIYASPQPQKDKTAKEYPSTSLQPRSMFPLREPERVYRVWIKDYEDENGFLISNHFIYVVVEGRWKIGVKEQTGNLTSEINYDRKIKDYLIRAGKIKPPEAEEDEDDEDI